MFEISALTTGNVHLSARPSGLPKPSVANVSLIVSVDKDLLTERVDKLPPSHLDLVLAGINTVLGK
jgi:mRNA interferase MazF